MFSKSQVNHKTHTHGHNTDIHTTCLTISEFNKQSGNLLQQPMKKD